jgi:flagellar hook-associated protein 1
MAGDLLGISVSGLNLSQTALRTAGHNIANANTEGYTRQTVTAEANPELFLGSGFLGNGVSVSSIERETNEFVVRQLRDDTSLYNEQKTLLDNASQLDNLLSNPALGLSDAMQRFYAALQTGADNPTSIAARQLIISEGQSLVDRFNALHERLEEINQSLNQKMEGGARDANALLDSIASYNQAIAKNFGTGAAPNDLLDKRDQALLELSELVGIRVNRLSDGQVDVALTTGESLILSDKVNKFDVVNSPEIPGNKDIAIMTNIGPKVISNQITGGQLGGLLGFRGGMLDKSFNEIGRIAVSLAGTFNSIHQQGIDLDGQFGGPMFADINSETAVRERVLHSPENKLPYNRDLTVDIIDPSQLTGSDYRMEIEEGSQKFSIVRVSDGEVVVSNLLTGRTPQNVEFDGIKVTFNGGVFQGGDQFYLQPSRGFSKAMTFDLLDPEELAFAKPLLAESELGNLGNGQVNFGEILSLDAIDGTDLPLFIMPGQIDPPMVIRFTSPTRFDVLDNSDPNAPKQLDPPIRNQLYVPGQVNSIFTTDPGELMLVAQGEKLGIQSATATSTPPTTLAPLTNGYPAERFIFTEITDKATGAFQEYSVITASNASAKDIAAQMSAVPGVSVNAWTEVRLSNIAYSNYPSDVPDIQLNGQTLLETTVDDLGATVLADNVPELSNKVEYMKYLADRINTFFAPQGINASTLTDSSGETYLKVVDSTGADVQLHMINASIEVSDGVSASSKALAAGEYMAVGGRFDVTLADGVTLKSIPPKSGLMGEIIQFDPNDMAKTFDASSYQRTYMGIQAEIKGSPQGGDGFTIKFNNDAASDNRNIMSMVNLELKATLNRGKASLSDVYGLLVEDVGIRTGAAKINSQASEGVLEQSVALRNSLSAVNLDEEAANLIKYEQMYSANAQAIAVARDVFERLINSI